MPPRQLLIFTALASEARAIAKQLDLDSHSKQSLASPSLHSIGLRAKHLPDHLLGKDVAGIIVAGLGGALDPSLLPGDIVIDDPAGVLRPEEFSAFRFGRIHTARDIIATPAEKAELFRATGALAVDMETAIVREATARLNVPIIAIRSISDAANETLHPELLSLIDDLGRVKLSAVASLLARRPQMLLSLLRLRGRSNAALRALGKASSSILRDSLASSF